MGRRNGGCCVTPPSRSGLLVISSAFLVLSCAVLLDAASTHAAPVVGGTRPRATLHASLSNTRVTVTDDFGNEVTVRYPPQRIVSLAPGPTAMLRAAGAGGRLVATIEYSDQAAADSRLPKIGSVDAIDIERLIALKPDVVVVWPDGNNPAQIATIERLGFPVYRQEAVTLDGMGASLRRLGKLTGTSRLADRAASALEARLGALRKEYSNPGQAPTVFLEVWDRPLYTIGGKELMSDALEVCGLRNVFADLPQRAPAIGIEAVLARNPDMIIAAAPPGQGATWLAEWRRFPALRAVRTGQLMDFEDQRLSGLGPGIVDATAALCRRVAVLEAKTERK